MTQTWVTLILDKVLGRIPASYPASRMLNLPVIKETGPVFDGKFKIVRDVAIGLESELAPVFGAGRTRPLKWTFPVGKLDTPRADLPQPAAGRPRRGY